MVDGKSASPHHPPPSKKRTTFVQSPLLMQQAPCEPSKHKALGSSSMTRSQDTPAVEITTANARIRTYLLFSMLFRQRYISRSVLYFSSSHQKKINILCLNDTLQMQGQLQSKSPKMDLITNDQIDLWNSEQLKYGYFQSGSIYLGAKQALNQDIYDKNIGAVLTVMDKKSYEKEKIRQKMSQIGLEGNHLFIQSQDHVDASLSKFYQQAYNFIQKNLGEGRNVFVHCKGGMSRSPALLCSYLMRKHDLNFQKCYELVKSRRNVVTINEGFMKELRKYEGVLKKNKK